MIIINKKNYIYHGYVHAIDLDYNNDDDPEEEGCGNEFEEIVEEESPKEEDIMKISGDKMYRWLMKKAEMFPDL